MTDSIPVSFACKKCRTKLTWPDDAVDTTKISCTNCGEYFGTYEDLRHTAMEAVKARTEQIMKDVLEGGEVRAVQRSIPLTEEVESARHHVR